MGRIGLLETYRTEALDDARSVLQAEALARSILSGVALAIDWTPAPTEHSAEPCSCAQCRAAADYLGAYERNIISGFAGAATVRGGK